jgi:Na+/H+ antiporter NhaD/arsenite permease-like protein
MLAGLTYISFYFFYLFKIRVDLHHTAKADPDPARKHGKDAKHIKEVLKAGNVDVPPKFVETKQHFDVFHSVAHLEWDTLLYFYGVMVSVGGLSFIGYLTLASNFLYSAELSPTIANVLVGIISAFIDNGTIMFAVLTMAPKISEGQWLLVTLTAGAGGSMLSIGSAAGVGLMGQTKGVYSFVSHLRWTPVVVLGYAASIVAHFLVNAHYF